MSCCSACGQHACACGCGAGARTPRSEYNRPGLSSLCYRVGTYADFQSTMQMDLSDAALPALAQLRTRERDDASMALLDAWAIGADVLSFYQERIANEGYLRTATERCSVLQLGRLLDYRLRPGVSASVYLAYTIDDNSGPVTIPCGAKAQSVPAPGEQMQTFETAEALDARHEWNALQPRLSLPQDINIDNIAGLSELWIAGNGSNLKPGDRMLFLFGDLVSGTQALRTVVSVEAQQSEPRARVVLQPLAALSVTILAATNTAINALAALGGGTNVAIWLLALIGLRKYLLFGGDHADNTDDLLDLAFTMRDMPATDPAPIAAYRAALDQAFGSSSGGGAPPPIRFTTLFDALTLAPTVQPASKLSLVRNVATALGVASDARPQLLLNFEARLVDTFYRSWTSVPHGQPSPALSGVFALHLAAPMFGYNAVVPMVMKINPDPLTVGKIPLVSAPGADWPAGPDEKTNVVQLDNAYDGITPDGYVVIQPKQLSDGYPRVAQVKSVSVHPRSAYGISGKTTEIALAPLGNQSAWDIHGRSDIDPLRGTQVFAQSEALNLADQIIVDEVGNTAAPLVPTDGATRLTLDQAVDGLKTGRWVIVSGTRADVPGNDAVTAAELVMLSAVEQGVDAQRSGDTVHSTLVFANEGLAYTYVRSSVKIYANVVRATHGETRNEVLGSGNGATALPSFALKQMPLTYVSASTVDGVQSTLSVSVNGMLWHEVRNLSFAGPQDRSFVTSTDDGGKTSVTFGDGVHGARPPTGVENLTAVYRNGIGKPGNVDAGQISLATTKPLGVKQVINPLRASGGADGETRDQARRNVPLAVLALDRLVSVSDYADFSRTFGGVGKAVATKYGAQVWVTIAGAADAPVDPSSDLYRNLLTALRQYGDPALPVTLDVRELVALTLSAKVGLQPDYLWTSIEPQVRAALLATFGFEQRGLAQDVYLSEIVACIQAVRGVAWVDVDAFGSLDEATLLSGFGADSKGDDGGVGNNGDGSILRVATFASNAVPDRVRARPTRRDDNGDILPAQLAYFLPDVPDTLLLQEATP